MKSKKIEKNNSSLLFIITVLAVAISMIGAGFTYYTVNQYKNTWFTGFALQSGDINLSVQTAALINFTTDSINWGSGKVNDGKSFATLNTSGSGSVADGNWTVVSQGFVVNNMGNVNLTLNLKTGSSAATFLGGTSPSYQFNVTNKESGSCTPPAGFTLSTYYNVNTTNPGTRVCDKFYSADSTDEIRIDIKLVVPSDSKTGTLGDTMTATIAQA